MEWAFFGKYLGASLAIGLSALGCGASEGIIAGKANEAIARQPKATGEILRTMLIGQAVTETAGIFGLLMAFVLIFVIPANGAESKIVSFISTGICMGLGGIGAGIGSGIAGASACHAIGRYPKLSVNILLTTLIGQAISQTGAIFALVVAMLLCLNSPESSNIGIIGALAGAGLAMGFGSIGAGTGSGIATAKAAEGLSRNPRANNVIIRTMLLGQMVLQADAIYSLIISFILITTALTR